MTSRGYLGGCDNYAVVAAIVIIEGGDMIILAAREIVLLTACVGPGLNDFLPQTQTRVEVAERERGIYPLPPPLAPCQSVTVFSALLAYPKPGYRQMSLVKNSSDIWSLQISLWNGVYLRLPDRTASVRRFNVKAVAKITKTA